MNVKTYINHFEENSAKGYGLYMEGGLGAENIADAIAKQLIEQGKSVIIDTSVELLEQAKSASKAGSTEENEFLETHANIDVLILTNLGAEHNTFEDFEAVYFLIFNRYEAMKPTIITTDYSYNDLLQLFISQGHDRSMCYALINRLRDASFRLTAA